MCCRWIKKPKFNDVCSVQHSNFCSRMLKMLSDFRGWGEGMPPRQTPLESCTCSTCSKAFATYLKPYWISWCTTQTISFINSEDIFAKTKQFSSLCHTEIIQLIIIIKLIKSIKMEEKEASTPVCLLQKFQILNPTNTPPPPPADTFWTPIVTIPPCLQITNSKNLPLS